MKQINEIAAKCNYAGYVDKHVTYPPQGPLPLPGQSTTADDGCDVWTMIFRAALIVNPAFNVYRIWDTYPILWDVLGFPCVLFSHKPTYASTHICTYSGSFEQIQIPPVYFDRQDVKKAIHAPQNVKWKLCSDTKVFPNGDASPPSALSVLPSVIEKSKKTVIIHGLADYVLITEG